MLARSFMISADNAHAVHPNHPEKSDPVNRPVLNGGIVIKFNASQRYCTDGLSAAMFREICHEADVPLQVYTNRSDMPGGSTLGNIAMTHTAKGGAPKILKQLTLPATAINKVDMIITELGVMEVTPEGLVLTELADGVTFEQVQACTEATLIPGPGVREA